MKPGLLPVALLGLVAVGGAVAMQTAGRERTYRALLGRGDAALREGDTFGAIEAFSGAVALHPDSMLAHLRRGESYRQRGELAAAARDFRTAAALDPAAARPLEALADVYYERQRYDRAIDTYERRLRLDARSPRVRYKQALAHYRAGHMHEALTALNDAIALDPRMPDAYYLRGLCLRDQQQAREAVEAFERAVTLAPGLIPAREELAMLYEQMGRYTSQLEQLQVLAALDSTQVQRQVAVGMAHARAGHPDAAAVTLANALERAPDDPLVYQEIGRMWLDVSIVRNDPAALQKALEAFDHLGAGPTASSEMLTLYGRALARNGELDAAQRLLEQATRRFPVSPDAFMELADVADQQHQPDTARRALLEYHALVGDDDGTPARAGRIGLLSLTLSDVSAAIHWLQRALASDAGNGRWWRGLADAEFQVGNLIGAQVALARALDLAPEDKELLAFSRRLSRALPLPAMPVATTATGIAATLSGTAAPLSSLVPGAPGAPGASALAPAPSTPSAAPSVAQPAVAPLSSAPAPSAPASSAPSPALPSAPTGGDMPVDTPTGAR